MNDNEHGQRRHETGTCMEDEYKWTVDKSFMIVALMTNRVVIHDGHDVYCEYS